MALLDIQGMDPVHDIGRCEEDSGLSILVCGNDNDY